MKNLIMAAIIILVGIVVVGGVFKKLPAFRQDTAANITQASMAPTPVPTTSTVPVDATWESSQTTSSGTDEASLEKDINDTSIATEDFADLN